MLYFIELFLINGLKSTKKSCKLLKIILQIIYPVIVKVVNDEDDENNGESKTDDDNVDESEDDVFGVTTVVNLKKHQVGT